MDPRKYNGAVFLGLNGVAVKSHGGTDSIGFYHSIDLCYKIIKGDLMGRIKKNLKRFARSAFGPLSFRTLFEMSNFCQKIQF